MPETEINIGGRKFTVSCQEGEEHFLQSAAKMLDAEAGVLMGQIGRLPESRLLLMSGLMLADKTAGLEEKLRNAEGKLGAQEALLEEMRAKSADAKTTGDNSGALANLAAQSEALADKVEKKSKAG